MARDESPSAGEFEKSRPGAPAGFFATEAAALRWLAEPGAVPVVEVLGVSEDSLRLARLESVPSTPQAAREFGRGLAALHDAGAPGFGWSPTETAWFGPLDDPFAVPTISRKRFAQFWAEDRLRPLLAEATSTLGADGTARVQAAVDAIGSGVFDGISGEGAESPARVHGDLWSGNVMWARGGATLIDPAAHGGHRLEDLAMLSLFGAPHLEEIYAGYEQAHPLPSDWREDLPAHVLFGLLAHVHLFGSGYVAQTVAVAETVLARAERLGA